MAILKSGEAKITETTTGWTVTWPQFMWELCGQYSTYPTAGEAAGAIRDAAKSMADNDLSSIITITWEPITKIGRMVAKAIASTR